MPGFITSQVVWVQWGGAEGKWFPAVVIDPRDDWVGLDEQKAGHQYVLWLGDGRITQVVLEDIRDFCLAYNDCFPKMSRIEKYMRATQIAVKLAAARADERIETEEEWEHWALENMTRFMELSVTASFYKALQRNQALTEGGSSSDTDGEYADRNASNKRKKKTKALSSLNSEPHSSSHSRSVTPTNRENNTNGLYDEFEFAGSPPRKSQKKDRGRSSNRSQIVDKELLALVKPCSVNIHALSPETIRRYTEMKEVRVQVDKLEQLTPVVAEETNGDEHKDERSTENDEIPTESDEKPIENDEMPIESDEKSIEKDEKPIKKVKKPFKKVKKAIGKDEKPVENEEKPIENDEIQTESDEKTNEKDEKPVENEEKPIEESSTSSFNRETVDDLEESVETNPEDDLTDERKVTPLKIKVPTKSKKSKSKEKTKIKKDSSPTLNEESVASAEAAEEKYLAEMQYGLKELTIDVHRLTDEEITKWTRSDRPMISDGSGTEETDLTEFIKPLEMGWRREITIRENHPQKVIYYSPDGDLIPNLDQLSNFLHQEDTNELDLENFSFDADVQTDHRNEVKSG